MTDADKPINSKIVDYITIFHPDLKFAYDLMVEKQEALDEYQDACEGGMLEYLFLKKELKIAKNEFKCYLDDAAGACAESAWEEYRAEKAEVCAVDEFSRGYELGLEAGKARQ